MASYFYVAPEMIKQLKQPSTSHVIVMQPENCPQGICTTMYLQAGNRKLVEVSGKLIPSP